MLEGPLGAAAFNNEFGRPNLAGYFRTFELEVDGPDGREVRGYHKPIMIAGGFGNIRAEHVAEGRRSRPARRSIVLGGPAMLIGLGGGAASSVALGRVARRSRLRVGAAGQRRDAAALPGGDRSLLGAGRRRTRSSRSTTSAPAACPTRCPSWSTTAAAARASTCARSRATSPGMSPLEIWCNEAQERYVLAIDPSALAAFEALCARERCPYAVLGHATDDGRLVVDDAHFGDAPDRHAAAGAARQAAEDDPRGGAGSPPPARPFDDRRRRRATRRSARAAAARPSPTRRS